MNEEAELKTKWFSFKAGSACVFFAGLCFAIGLLIAMLVYQHSADAKHESVSLTGAIRELARSQREMACVISLPMEKREREYLSSDSYCRRLSSMQ